MARPPADASKTSLYRLNLSVAKSSIEAVQQKYLDRGFRQESLDISDRPALLVYGTISNEYPEWVRHVHSLADFRPPVSNEISAGVLLIRLEDSHNRCYALSWGMGHLLLEQAYVDTGFGLRFALRKADSDQVSALTSHALDTLPKTARMSVFGGASLSAFGLEEIGEVISRLVGRIPAQGLSAEPPESVGKVGKLKKVANPKFITIRGADALSIPLAKLPHRLLADLKLIDDVVENEAPVQGLEHLENTHPLRPGNPKIKELNSELSSSLMKGASRLALCWPSEWDDEGGEAAKFRISGLGNQWDGVVDELELDDLLQPLVKTPVEKRLLRLKGTKVQGLDSGGSEASRAISGDRWITFETTLSGERYVFHRGRWYNVGGAYLDLLRERIGRIMKNKSGLTLPVWPKMVKKRKKSAVKYIDYVTEGIYNDYIVGEEEGFYSLDRKMVRTRQHPRGFESCDILTPDNAMVHVKRLDDSVSASHLFNQAIVSAEALRRQVDALDKFREVVLDVSGGERVIPSDFRVKEVVLAFIGGAAEPGSLFTFSQVTLSRCAQRLEELDINLTVAQIPTSDDIYVPKATQP